MRALIVGLLAAAALVFFRPWRYTWAFGQDAGAAQSADWRDKPCSKELASALYGSDAGTAFLAREGNRFFYAGQPGHSYYVHGFRSQKACERARTSMGNAQWDQSTR
jgi:hypothetical protein